MTNDKQALLIIDMQNDVMKKLVQTAPLVIPSIQKILTHFRHTQDPVIYIKRIHQASGVDVERFRLEIFKKQPFLIEGTPGSDVIDALAPLASEYTVNKQRFSGFFQSELLMLLMRLQVTSVVICGVQTPNCIRCTVTDALAYDFDVTVLQDATAAQNAEVHDANLFDMHNMGANIQTVADFLADKI